VPAKPESRGAVTLLVGAGRMGSALLKGWVASGLRPIVAVEPNPGAGLKAFARRRGIRLLTGIERLDVPRVRACVVAIKPQVLKSEAGRFRDIAQSGAVMLSIAAGTSIAALRKDWGRGACVIRAMPNTPGSIGKGISALYAPRGTSLEARACAESLVAGLGQTLWVNQENLIDVVTAVSGSGPAYVFFFAECLADAARAQGLPPDSANRLARATISGAGAMLDCDPRGTQELRRDVTSPGGTTEAALQVLTKNGALGRLVREAVCAARQRATELREEAETHRAK
jgi:pyrroline-5-carboxylate reductase